MIATLAQELEKKIEKGKWWESVYSLNERYRELQPWEVIQIIKNRPLIAVKFLSQVEEDYLKNIARALKVPPNRGKILVKLFDDINIMVEGWTPLLWATHQGNVDMVRELLKEGADPNVSNISGQTPLHIAAMNGKLDIFKVLLIHGARLDVYNAEGRTPLHSVLITRNPFAISQLYKCVIELKGIEPADQVLRVIDIIAHDNRDEVKEILPRLILHARPGKNLAEALLGGLFEGKLYETLAHKDMFGRVEGWKNRQRLLVLARLIDNDIARTLYLPEVPIKKRKGILRIFTMVNDRRWMEIVAKNTPNPEHLLWNVSVEYLSETLNLKKGEIEKALKKHIHILPPLLQWAPIVRLFKKGARVLIDHLENPEKRYDNFEIFPEWKESYRTRITLKENEETKLEQIKSAINDFVDRISISNIEWLNDIIEGREVYDFPQVENPREKIRQLTNQIHTLFYIPYTNDPFSKLSSVSGKIKKSLKELLIDYPSTLNMLLQSLNRLESIPSKEFIDGEYMFEITDRVDLMLLMGKSKHIRTCQAYDDPEENKLGLLGAMVNPFIKMAVVYQELDIVGRRKLLLVKKDEVLGIVLDVYFGHPGIKSILDNHLLAILEEWKSKGNIGWYSEEGKDVQFLEGFRAPFYFESPINGRMGLVGPREAF